MPTLQMKKNFKRMLCFVLALLIFGSSMAFAADDPKYTERKNKKDEAWLWDELSQYSPNDYITAGVLAYFYRESQYRSDAVCGWYSALVWDGLDICSKIMKKTDKGLSDGSTKKYFIKAARDHGGYGLGQWSSMHHLEALYDFAVDYGTSIGDARMQCAWIFDYMQSEAEEEFWGYVIKSKTAEHAGRLIAIYIDGTTTGIDYIGWEAERLYKKYHEED